MNKHLSHLGHMFQFYFPSYQKKLGNIKRKEKKRKNVITIYSRQNVFLSFLISIFIEDIILVRIPTDRSF